MLAACLLGYDSAYEENAKFIAKLKADFADDNDDRAERAGDLDLRFDVPPTEAIDYFKRKNIVTKKEFDELSNEAKSASFYVSGIYRQDILEAFKKEITDALESGQTQKYVVKQFKEILDGADHPELGDFHLETIFRSNMALSQGYGRRKQMEEVADLLPYWQRKAVNDDRTRPKHRALNGVIFPADHEFWDDHFCPDDFNCRCTIISLLDYPTDYNHERPNADTTIIYDEKGLPAKAEYQTQVVDLKATNFVGVPRTSSLEGVLKDSADRAQIAKRERDNYKTPQSVIEKAKQIRNEKVEVAHLYDGKGKSLLEFRGNDDSVVLEIPDDLNTNGGILVHNHPPTGDTKYESFSPDDIAIAAEMELTETLVVTKNYLYSMRPPKTGWNETWADKINEAFPRFYSEVFKEFYERFRDGEMTLGEIKDVVRHNVWKNVAKELGLRYKRKKV